MTNEYENETFFRAYAGMARSREGLKAAGDWPQFRTLMPPLEGKRVLDLGCGYGWHCHYAAEMGARQVLGIDASERMVEEARHRNPGENITYRVCPLEAYDYPAEAWDVVISNLALHYVADLTDVFRRVLDTLCPGGVLLFNIEHPVFTAGVGQDWVYRLDGTPAYWPVDGYFNPGPRRTHFLGCEVVKQHHTLTQILGGLLKLGFVLEAVEEVQPPEEMMNQPGMADELRRPMMLLVRAHREKKPD